MIIRFDTVCVISQNQVKIINKTFSLNRALQNQVKIIDSTLCLVKKVSSKKDSLLLRSRKIEEDYSTVIERQREDSLLLDRKIRRVKKHRKWLTVSVLIETILLIVLLK